jgi:hypothetical protein
MTGFALLISMGATAALAGPERPHMKAECAVYDLHIVTLIEDHGLVEETESQVLWEAASRMLEARAACSRGDTQQGLQIYDSITLEGVRLSPFYRVLMR